MSHYYVMLLYREGSVETLRSKLLHSALDNIEQEWPWETSLFLLKWGANKEVKRRKQEVKKGKEEVITGKEEVIGTNQEEGSNLITSSKKKEVSFLKEEVWQAAAATATDQTIHILILIFI